MCEPLQPFDYEAVLEAARMIRGDRRLVIADGADTRLVIKSSYALSSKTGKNFKGIIDEKYVSHSLPIDIVLGRKTDGISVYLIDRNDATPFKGIRARWNDKEDVLFANFTDSAFLWDHEHKRLRPVR